MGGQDFDWFDLMTVQRRRKSLTTEFDGTRIVPPFVRIPVRNRPSRRNSDRKYLVEFGTLLEFRFGREGGERSGRTEEFLWQIIRLIRN